MVKSFHSFPNRSNLARKRFYGKKLAGKTRNSLEVIAPVNLCLIGFTISLKAAKNEIDPRI